MKNLIICAFLFSTFMYGQADFGVKGGINYNNAGDGVFKISSSDLLDGGKNKAGFHLGAFVQAKVPVIGLYVRPEFVYTSLTSEYNWEDESIKGKFKLNKIDIPILVGTTIVGPLHAFIGPAFQLVVDSDFDAEEIKDIETDNFSLGIQMGIGLRLGKLGVDVRWERGLSNTQSKLIQNASTSFASIDIRPNQIIFGLSYTFSEK